MQTEFEQLKGVDRVVAGYSGGTVANPTYEQVCSETTGHAETVQITFNPSVLTYADLLRIYFTDIDPTTLNRQGNDRGMSYRSAIFYTSDEQRRIANDTIADVEASGLWPGKVVTEVTAAGPFWEAEPEHQDYLERVPNGYTCHFVLPGWKLPHRADAA